MTSLTELKGNVVLGNSTATITQNATRTVSNMTVGTDFIKIVNGNSVDFTTSMTTTFNRKISTSASTINCYRLTANGSPNEYMSQFMELIVSGSNNSVGGFAHKMSFVVENDQSIASVVNQTILSSYHNLDTYALSVPVNVSFTVVSIYEITIRIQTPTNPADIKQNFVSTLIAYPAVRLDNTGGSQLFNWKIEAI